MKIVFLDAKTIGDDIDLSGYEALGEVIKYGFSTAEEAAERAKDADVLVINKVEINEKSIGEADHLKLVCVTATGTNNLDKEYLAVALHGGMWQDIPRNRLHSILLHYYSIYWRNYVIMMTTLRLRSMWVM